MIETSSVYKTIGFGFSQAIVADDLLFCSGIVGWDRNYQLQGKDFNSQLSASFKNIENLLKSTGTSFNDIVLMRFYITELNSTNRKGINEQMSRYFTSGYKPATTLLGINHLAREELKVEIEIIAKAHHTN